MGRANFIFNISHLQIIFFMDILNNKVKEVIKMKKMIHGLMDSLGLHTHKKVAKKTVKRSAPKAAAKAAPKKKVVKVAKKAAVKKTVKAKKTTRTVKKKKK